MLQALAVSNYRSLRDVVAPLGPLTLVTGANGSGKSNLYRALRLLVEVGRGAAIGSLASEGGLDSVMWAGPEVISRRMKRGDVPVQGSRRKRPLALRVGFSSDHLGYAVDLGLPVLSESAFGRDPEIKRESIWHGPNWGRRAALVERSGGLVEARDEVGAWQSVTTEITSDESMLTWAADPRTTPEAFAIRRELESWRFYDQFRTDRDAPARHVRIGTRTPILAHDGADLPAALQTIIEIGDPAALASSLDEAFEGTKMAIEGTDGGLRLALQQPGLLRPLDQSEVSDGTLRYLCWIAALHTPRPPPLMILNEPETSLHQDLLPALGRLIERACSACQVLVVSHAPTLIEVLMGSRSCTTLRLHKQLSETCVDSEGIPTPSWTWPRRG